MNERFIGKKFSQKSLEIIAAAAGICDKYAAAGFRLTLRQLYYQFVAHQPLTFEWQNTEKNYKRLGSIVNDARLAGEIDWDAIEDRGREVIRNSHWDHPRQILEACSQQFRIDTWEDQPTYCIVMVEKQALEGVLKPVCRRWDIPFVANKGYSSASALYRLGKEMGRIRELHGRELHVLYLGDHDPSGIDMTRDVQERLELFSRGEVHVSRLALTIDQVEEYEPPPNPAKLTDSRCSGYISEYGPDCWELDALDPDVLVSLVDVAVEELIDWEQAGEKIRKQAAWREKLLEVARQSMSWE